MTGEFSFLSERMTHPTRGILVFLPKPLAELLGNPPSITFMLKGKRIEVLAKPDSQAKKPSLSESRRESA